MHPATTPSHAPSRPTATPWRELGAVPPARLTGARTQLHHAAQVANSAAISLLPPEPDDSHTNFGWNDAAGALVARRIPAPRPLRFALRVADLTLLALGDDAVSAGFPLDRRSRDEAFAWVVERVALAGADASRMTMRRHFEIPGEAPTAAHPFALGDGAAFRELAAYWSDAAQLLDAVARSTPGASEVRCWPHHFDIATLITEADLSGATTGLGMSPGDEYYDEPYFYIGPNPHPDTTALSRLAVGRWHTARWVGAVLTASELTAAGGAAEQQRMAAAFASTTLAMVRALHRPRSPGTSSGAR